MQQTLEPTGAAADKRRLRADIQARRLAIPEAVRLGAGSGVAAAVLALPEAARIRSVGLYISLPTEPPTGRLRAELRGRGVRVLLPVLREGGDLDWASDQGNAALVTGRGGVEHPDRPWLGKEAIAAADLVIVPALAVARDGVRLGRGGGSYDRALERVPGHVPVLALVWDGEVLDAGALPHEPHDRPVTGWVQVPAG